MLYYFSDRGHAAVRIIRAAAVDRAVIRAIGVGTCAGAASEVATTTTEAPTTSHGSKTQGIMVKEVGEAVIIIIIGIPGMAIEIIVAEVGRTLSRTGATGGSRVDGTDKEEGTEIIGIEGLWIF